MGHRLRIHVPEKKLVDLYIKDGLSHAAIADQLGVSRKTVKRRLDELGVPTRTARKHPPLSRGQLLTLYVKRQMTFEKIAEELGTSVAWVQAEFDRLDVPARRRGVTRYHRHELDIEEVVQLYVHEDLSAKEVGLRLGVSPPQVLRALHQEGIAVRRRGARRSYEPSDEVEVLAGLYSDDALTRVLERYGIEKRWEVGPVTRRFPKPVPLTKALLKGLYLKAGLSADQIELVTGQPRLRVRSMLRDFGVELRPPGTPAPITLRIWQVASGNSFTRRT